MNWNQLANRILAMPDKARRKPVALVVPGEDEDTVVRGLRACRAREDIRVSPSRDGHIIDSRKAISKGDLFLKCRA